MSMPISGLFLVAAILCGDSDNQSWPPQWEWDRYPRDLGAIYAGEDEECPAWQDTPAVTWPGLEGNGIFDFDPWAEARSPRTSESTWLGSRLVALYPSLARWPTLAGVLVHKKGYEPSIWRLQAEAERNKDFPPGDILLAKLRAEAKRPKDAREALEDAVRRRPEDPEPYIILADIALREGRFVEAQATYEKAAQLVKKLTGDQPRQDRMQRAILSGLVGVAESRDDWSSAQNHREKLLKLEEKDKSARRATAGLAATLQEFARDRFWQGDAVGAFDKLREAHKIDPENVLQPETTLALFYEQYGDHPHAASGWETP